MEQQPGCADEENAFGYNQRQKSPSCRKLILVFCLVLVAGTTFSLTEIGTFARQKLWKHVESTEFIIVLRSHFTQDYVPFSQDTVYHLQPISHPSNRWKRNVGSSASGEDGSANEASANEASANEESGNEDSGNEASASGETEATTSMEASAEETTKPSMIDATTKSLFDISGSGDFTTAAEMSGEETTVAESTTRPLFEMSGSGDTTTEASGEMTTAVTATTGMSGDTTTEASGDTTTDVATDFETTTFQVTTGAVVPPEETSGSSDGVPLFVAIALLIAGIILGVLLVFGIQALLKWMKSRKAVTPSHSRVGSTVSLEPNPTPGAIWEDALLKAMALGQIGVLEFALIQSRSVGLMQENPNLVTEAETKLNTWKRTHTQLERAYREKDLSSMDEFMERFNECEIKDESGIYQRCVDLKWNIKHAELDMTNATNARDEAMLMAAIGQYEALKLQDATMQSNQPYQEAKKVMNELRQDKLSEGRSWEVIRADLRAAVLAREPVAIAATLNAFIRAEVPDTYNDVENAKRTLEMIEAERTQNLSTAQKKLEDASISRDQDSLREAIEECKKYGSPEEELKEPEKLLRVVEREDKLLGELRELTTEADITKLSNAIVVFKTPSLGMVDKTGDLKAAEEALEELKQKERQRKTKEDVVWRLQNAMAVGDIAAMDAMIKALQALAAAGEEIDEPLLIRAMSELEANRGQVDYRKRMEAIKNALARTIAAENIPQTQDLVDQMSLLAEDEEYTMTADDLRVLDDARTSLNTMRDKKEIIDEIARVRPDLLLSLIPPHLVPLQKAVERMSVAKTQAEPFPGVFSEEDDVLLEDAKVNSKVLENKVEHMNDARKQLDWAVEQRDYSLLKSAIRNAITAPFIDRKEIVEPRKLAVFLDPKARRGEVKRAIRARDIKRLDIALQDLNDAKVDDPELVAKGERTLEKLKKREKRRAKEERRKEREDAARAEEIAHLKSVLEQAIASKDTEHLQLALEEFEESGYDVEDVPVATEAEELFDNLKIQDIRDRLMDSVQRRDVNGLETAIDDADYGGYVMDVKGEYDIAKDLLYHLRELNRLREAISEMSRSLISEIYKYPTPPPPVHQVMTAVFILLGEPPSQMKNWNEVQALLGKMGQNSITRRVKFCVPGDIPSKAVNRAKQQMEGLKLEELSVISKGAATFFAWATCMIKEHAQVSLEQRALADLEPLPEIPGIPDRPTTTVGGYRWT